MQALKRILVQQVLTDGLNLVFEPQEAEAMHQGATSMLANNEDIDRNFTKCKLQYIFLYKKNTIQFIIKKIEPSIPLK